MRSIPSPRSAAPAAALLLGLLHALPVQAQLPVPVLTWSTALLAKTSATPVAIAADGKGGAVLAGRFKTLDLKLGTTMLRNRGDSDAYLARFDAQGKLRWAVSGGSPGEDQIAGVAVDAAGDVVLVGGYGGEFVTGAERLGAAGQDGLFVAKYGPDGALRWLRGGGAQVLARGAAADAQGNIYVTGAFRGELALGTERLKATGDWDVFVAKYGPEGKLLWARAEGGSEDDEPQAIALDPAGQGIYVAGTFAWTSGSEDVKTTVLSLDADGKRRWRRDFPARKSDSPVAIAAGAQGSVYLTGSFRQRSQWDSVTMQSAGPNGFADIYLVRLGGDGALAWARQFGGPSMEAPRALSADGAGNVYLGGYFQGELPLPGQRLKLAGGSSDGFLLRISALGEVSGVMQVGGEGSEVVAALHVLPDGSLVAAGEFRGAVALADQRLQGEDGDTFVLLARFSGGAEMPGKGRGKPAKAKGKR